MHGALQPNLHYTERCTTPTLIWQNLGLYAERIGAMSFVLSDKDAADRVLSQMKRIARKAGGWVVVLGRRKQGACWIGRGQLMHMVRVCLHFGLQGLTCLRCFPCLQAPCGPTRLCTARASSAR